MSTTSTKDTCHHEKTSPKRFYWFSYATNPSRDLRRKGFDIHKTRDGGMFADLSVSLYACGYQYAGNVLNLPPDYAPEFREPTPLVCSPDDFVVLPTRPPLDDADSELKKFVDRSCTNEEQKVFAILQHQVLEFLDRSRAILLPSMTAHWSDETRPFSEAQFKMLGPAPVTQLYQGQRPEDAYSLGYLICTRGPEFRLLTAFGMSGSTTSLWGELLRTTYAADLQKWINSSDNHLVICRLSLPEKYPYPLFHYNLDRISHDIVVDLTF